MVSDKSNPRGLDGQKKAQCDWEHRAGEESAKGHFALLQADFFRTSHASSRICANPGRVEGRGGREVSGFFTTFSNSFINNNLRRRAAGRAAAEGNTWNCDCITKTGGIGAGRFLILRHGVRESDTLLAGPGWGGSVFWGEMVKKTDISNYFFLYLDGKIW